MTNWLELQQEKEQYLFWQINLDRQHREMLLAARMFQINFAITLMALYELLPGMEIEIDSTWFYYHNILVT